MRRVYYVAMLRSGVAASWCVWGNMRVETSMLVYVGVVIVLTYGRMQLDFTKQHDKQALLKEKACLCNVIT